MLINMHKGISHLKDFFPKNNNVEANKPIQADLELVKIIQNIIKITNIREIILLKGDSFLIKNANDIGKTIFNHAPAQFGLLNNPVRTLFSKGLEYQIIKPSNISKGPCKSKKTCPIPVNKTGTEPASRAKAQFLLCS